MRCPKQGLEARGELLNPDLAAIDQTEAMIQQMKETLTRIEYLDPQNPDHIFAFVPTPVR